MSIVTQIDTTNNLHSMARQNRLDLCPNPLNVFETFLSSEHLVDIIILCNTLNISEKKELILELMIYSMDRSTPSNLNISSKTISNLLMIKEDKLEYIQLFHILILFSLHHKLSIFTYDHVYHLILQMWMDNNNISDKFRKIIIFTGLNENESLISSIFDRIKQDTEIWFSNLSKNFTIRELFNWFCQFDKTNQLIRMLKLYEDNQNKMMAYTKDFIKLHDITIEEYRTKQDNAKKNGRCKYIRNKNDSCPYGVKCLFYHGKIEETYGVQVCKAGLNCMYLPKSECKFYHEPSSDQLNDTMEIYLLLKCWSGDINHLYLEQKNLLYHKPLVIDKKKSKYIDSQAKINPFFIINKIGTSTKNAVLYTIPTCECSITDIYGTESICHKAVSFMTNGTKKSNFYCSYDHMINSKKKCQYIVKQNIVDKICATYLN